MFESKTDKSTQNESKKENTTDSTTTKSEQPIERTDPAVAYTYRGVDVALVNPCGYPVVMSDPNITTFRWDAIIYNLGCGFESILSDIAKAITEYANVIADATIGFSILTLAVTRISRIPTIRRVLGSLM